MDIQSIIQAQRNYFASNVTKDYHFRFQALKTLKEGILNYKEQIIEAMHKDLGKAPMETIMTELAIVMNELNHTLKHLKRWMKPQKVHTPLVLFAAKSRILQEPFGVVLIMSPWNYPFQLAIDPLIGAIAAGNCAIIKPASYAKHTSEVIYQMIQSCFKPEFITTILGGREENKSLLEQRFDYLFFTGSTHVGRTVMEKAAVHLTPMTLELGGKSPVIIDGTLSMPLTAKRIAFGKFVNAGQTCVAPDYVLIKREYRDAFIESLKQVIQDFFGENPLQNPDLPKIINKHHHERLLGYLKDQTIAIGGTTNETKITPTVLIDVNFDSPVMKDEIFGPILPVIAYDDIDNAIQYIKLQEKPLALYLFTTDQKLQKRVLKEVSFGGGTINDTLMHVASSHLPFGGVGFSGLGNYHGIDSFKTFSHAKSVLVRSRWIDLSFRYHPYTKTKRAIIEKFSK
jgi:aldehyde dehydrogenase (NAD+)